MKKLFFFLLVLPLVFMSCGSDNDDPENNINYLYAIQIDRIDYKFGKPDLTTKTRISYRIFNKDGYVLSYDSIYVSWAGLIPHKANFKYNGNNQIIEETRSGLSKERIEYFYNSDGTLSEEKIYTENGISKIFKYTYKDGVLIRKDEESIVDYYHLYEYNTQGLLSKEYQYNKSDDKLFYSYIYEYDSKKNLIKKRNISPEGKEQIVIDYIYEYNNNGKVTQLTSKKLLGDIDVYKYNYNQETGLVERMDFFDGKTNEQIYYCEYKYIYR